MGEANKRRLAIGFFDGVHLGHQAILAGADEVLTFANHPRTILAPEKVQPAIMTLEERIQAMGRPVMVLPFTRELAEMTAEEFARRFLAGKEVRCGANWRFGREGEGDAKWLKEHGYAVEVIPYAEYEGEIISSTRIRAALAAGEIGAANAMLGREYVFRGVSERGKGAGRELGFPTINLRRGVYKVEVGGKRAVANYGVAPTFGDKAWERPVLEVHFLEFIRDEKRFETQEELKRQIADDCERAKGK